MAMLSLDKCICNTTISASKPHCNKTACISELIDRLGYLFDEQVTNTQKRSFIELFPISVNKTLMRRELFNFSTLENSLQEKLLNYTLLPLEFILPLINIDFPKYLPYLQQHPKLKSIAILIRKKKFNSQLVNRLERLSSEFARFLYSSRKESFWKKVLNTLIRSSFTPDSLLIYLDYLYRQIATEYQEFISILQSNTRLSRQISYLNSMLEESQKHAKLRFEQYSNNLSFKPVSNSDNQKDPEIIPNDNKITFILNKLSSHWYPPIRAVISKYEGLYKSSVIDLYNKEYNWNKIIRPEVKSSIIDELHLAAPEAQKESLVLFEMVKSLVKHPKIPLKFLIYESQNKSAMIRYSIATMAPLSKKLLLQQSTDTNYLVRRTAQMRLKWYEHRKGQENPLLCHFPEQFENWLTNNHQTQYY